MGSDAAKHDDKNIGRIVRLKCTVQDYAWGKIGKESSVARLYGLNRGANVDEIKPYAEFWMGTHVSGPSYVSTVTDNAVTVGSSDLGLSLKTWIEQNPGVLGDKVFAKWGPDLPFLFKVLSVGRALSIQAHPDKELAGILNKKQPNVYKDDNHKPEMALALTEFEALCGFISVKELKEVAHNVPEILEVISKECANKVLHINEHDPEEKAKDILRSLFIEIMSASKDVITLALSKLITRLTIKSKGEGLTEKEQLIILLEKQYPTDVGVLAAILMNYVKLKPGQALHIGANEPHAYIYGECIECMATSDNVVRAGLTPKKLDVQILCSMLTYKQGFPEILEGVAVNEFTTRYFPPFDEFEVDRCILPEKRETVFPASSSPSIFLVIKGKGIMSSKLKKEVIGEGDVLFTAADTEVIVGSECGLNLYRAGVNSKLL